MSAIKNEVIVGREDLRRLGVIPPQFPAPIFLVDKEKFTDLLSELIRNHPDVITDDLPQG